MKRSILATAFLAATCVAPALQAAGPVALKTTEFGRGPTVVLVHGLGGARMSWMPTARKLLGGHRVVMVDLPGHGESALPDPFSLSIAADALDRVLAGQKAESTVVVGQGLGGMLALLAASAHPERVKGVVVIDAATKFGMQIPDQQQRYFLSYLDEHYDEFLKGMYARAGRDSAQGVTLHAQAALVPAASMKAYLKALLNADASKALKGFKAAFLYVGTEKGWPADKDWPALAKQFGYEEPGSIAARRLANCGPMVMSEQPDSLAALISEFAAKAIAKK